MSGQYYTSDYDGIPPRWANQGFTGMCYNWGNLNVCSGILLNPTVKETPYIVTKLGDLAFKDEWNVVYNTDLKEVVYAQKFAAALNEAYNKGKESVPTAPPIVNNSDLYDDGVSAAYKISNEETMNKISNAFNEGVAIHKKNNPPNKLISFLKNIYTNLKEDWDLMFNKDKEIKVIKKEDNCHE